MFVITDLVQKKLGSGFQPGVSSREVRALREGAAIKEGLHSTGVF